MPGIQGRPPIPISGTVLFQLLVSPSIVIDYSMEMTERNPKIWTHIKKLMILHLDVIFPYFSSNVIDRDEILIIINEICIQCRDKQKIVVQLDGLERKIHL